MAHVEKRADERARPTAAGAKPFTASKHVIDKSTRALSTNLAPYSMGRLALFFAACAMMASNGLVSPHALP
jgi:hypothetical protein